MPDRHGALVLRRALSAAALGAASACAACGSPPRERVPPAPAPLHATPATFARVFAGARGGQTIRLASGSYGRFEGGAKRSPLTIESEGRARVSISLSFTDVANLRLRGLTIAGAEIRGRSHDVTIARSRFTRAALVDTTAPMVDANIVFDGDVFSGIDRCEHCYEGRLTIHGSEVNTRPVGVTVKNSLFNGGGDADGILVGSYGVHVLNNEFTGIHQVDAVHTDALQLYGQSHTVIRGNWFHDVADGIMAPDGGDHELVEDNVFDFGTGEYPFAVSLGSDVGSVIRHNTFRGGACAWRLPCGILKISAGNKRIASRGTVVTDNIVGRLMLLGGSQIAEQARNLIASGGVAGAGDVAGLPTYTGGPEPATLRAFRLAPRSLGTRRAADGTDLGADVGAAGRRP